MESIERQVIKPIEFNRNKIELHSIHFRYHVLKKLSAKVKLKMIYDLYILSPFQYHKFIKIKFIYQTRHWQNKILSEDRSNVGVEPFLLT